MKKKSLFKRVITFVACVAMMLSGIGFAGYNLLGSKAEQSASATTTVNTITSLTVVCDSANSTTPWAITYDGSESGSSGDIVTGVTSLIATAQGDLCELSIDYPGEPEPGYNLISSGAPVSTTITLSSDKYYKISTTQNDAYYFTLTEVFPVEYKKNTTNDITGTLPTDDGYYAVGEQVTISSDTISRTGYTFGGWNVSSSALSGLSTTYTIDSENITSNKIILYAVWTATSYNITYELDGGVQNGSNPATYTIENEVTLCAPTKTNCKFLGWFTENTFENEVTKIDVGSTGAKTFYAKWENAKTIVYDVNGATSGEAPTDDTNYYLDDVISSFASTSGITKTGYNLLGWNLDSTSTTALTTYTVSASNVSDNQIKLYAVWELITYSKDFNVTVGSVKYGTTVSNLTISLSENDISVKSVTIRNGSDEVSTIVATGTYDIEIAIKSNSDLPFKVGDVARGIPGIPVPVDYYGTIKVNNEERTGFIGDSSSISTPETFKEVVITYSVEVENVTIHYDGNNATEGSATSDETYCDGQTVTLASQGSLLRTGYTFGGWALSNDATSALSSYSANSADDTEELGYVTLYAVWVDISHGTHDGIIFNKVLTSQFTGGTITEDSNYYLFEDVTLESTLTIAAEATVNICLNGRVLNLNGHYIAIEGTLKLYDCDDATIRYFTDSKKNNGTELLDGTDGIFDKYIGNTSETPNAVEIIGGVIFGGNNTYGGACYADSNSKLEVHNVNFVGNSAFVEGGAVHGEGNSAINIYDSTFVGNSSNNGGAVSVLGKANIYSSTFKYNQAFVGGAVFVSGKTLIKDSIISNNVANQGTSLGFGGGICVANSSGALTLINTEVTENSAVNGAGVYIKGNQSCLIEGTKITMADGSLKNIENVNIGDYVRAFNHETGSFSSEKVYLAYSGTTTQKAIILKFTNNIELGICGEHDLFEKSAMKYVTINKYNYEKFVGKYFYNATNGRWEQLLSASKSTEEYNYYSIYTANKFNSISNNMLTGPDDIEHVLNVFEFNDDLTVNQAKKQADIEKYGLNCFEDCEVLTEEEFYNTNYQYMKVAIGKGLVTMEALWRQYREAVGCNTQSNSYGGALVYGDAPEITCETYAENITCATLILGSNAKIYNNKIGTVENNIYVENGMAIRVVSGATNIQVSVMLEDETDEFMTGVYSNSLKTAGDNPTQSIKIENTGYGLKITAVGETPNVTYTYSITKYTVVYDANGKTEYTGTLPTETNTFDNGDSYPISADTLSKAGLVFVGWNTNKNATAKLTNFTISELLDTDNDGVIKVYAIWKAKDEVSISISTQSYEYSGAGQVFVLKGTNKDLGGFTVLYRKNGSGDEYSSTLPKNAGSYDVKISRNETSEYKEYLKTISNGLVISKATLTDNTSVLTKTYDGVAITVNDILNHISKTVVGFKASDTFANSRDTASDIIKYYKNVYVSEDYNNQIINVKNDGDHKINYKFTFENYNLISQDIFVIIQKANYDMSAVVFENKTIEYDGEAHNCVVSGTLPKGIDNFTLQVSYDKSNMIEVGSYQVTATFTASINYNTPASKTVTFTIKKANNPITNLVQNNVELGEAINPSASSKFGTIVYSYRAVGASEFIALDVANEVYPKVAGKYELKAFVQGTDSYCDSVKYITFEVKPVNINSVVAYESEDVFTTRTFELVKGEFDTDNYKVVITKNSGELSEQVLENIKQKVSKKSEVISQFSLHIENKYGVTIENIPGNKYRISLKLPDELKGKKGYSVVYIDENNNVEKYNTNLVGGDTIVFETEHFSNWAIVANKYTPNPIIDFIKSNVGLVIVICLVIIVAVLFIVLILLKKKVTFVAKDKVIKVQKYKFNEKINLSDELKKYSWFVDKELKKPLEKKKIGLFGFKVYGKIKAVDTKEK